MKTRLDFVTNSSSSSFIITNNSNEIMTSEDIARKLDAICRLITLREQQLKKLDQLASSRFFGAITSAEMAA